MILALVFPSCLRRPTDEDGRSYRLATTPTSFATAVTLKQAHCSTRGTTLEQSTFDTHPVEVTPVTVAFKVLWYSVPVPSEPKSSIDVQKGISGVARAGTITVLLGSSGAGKTTLMKVIAGREDVSSIRDQILLNGHKATKTATRKCVGCCKQTPTHVLQVTCVQRFPPPKQHVSESDKRVSVDEIIDLLGLPRRERELLGAMSPWQY